MTKLLRSTFILTLAVALAVVTAAVAAGPLKGRTYRANTPTTGTDSEGHPQHIASVGLSLRVSSDGRSVTVRFLSSTPILYCGNQLHVHSQVTKAVSISRSGSFRSRVGEKFGSGPGETAVSQIVSGRFNGHTVKGTIRTEPAECGGVTSFTATAH
jgi:hypothetical protein